MAKIHAKNDESIVRLIKTPNSDTTEIVLIMKSGRVLRKWQGKVRNRPLFTNWSLVDTIDAADQKVLTKTKRSWHGKGFRTVEK